MISTCTVENHYRSHSSILHSAAIVVESTVQSAPNRAKWLGHSRYRIGTAVPILCTDRQNLSLVLGSKTHSIGSGHHPFFQTNNMAECSNRGEILSKINSKKAQYRKSYDLKRTKITHGKYLIIYEHLFLEYYMCFYIERFYVFFYFYIILVLVYLKLHFLKSIMKFNCQACRERNRGLLSVFLIEWKSKVIYTKLL